MEVRFERVKKINNKSKYKRESEKEIKKMVYQYLDT